MNKANLICFPHAGGSKFSYNRFIGVASGGLNIIPVELPGRGARIHEKLIENAYHMVDDVFEQIEPKIALDVPYAIYGHSMGALIGYLITRRIARESMPMPIHLFFSGAKPPFTLEEEPPVHLFKREELIDQLRRLGGIPDRILNNENLIRFLEPIVRADFRVIRTYQHHPEQPFNVPITVIIGTHENISRQQALLWQKETVKKTEVKFFEGDHFFIFDHAKEIMKLVDQRINQTLATNFTPLISA